ncbi:MULTISPECIES: hypothetical protein [unclassified Exiguobacterium]|uniref:hypothetical protein n=1 Tax=unclassified Exiguobacterium TaxID=2644629 RepID=UPI001BEC2DD1|nr:MULTISPECIES: hypothetical protein [unclassified Exiguobacterium]
MSSKFEKMNQVEREVRNRRLLNRYLQMYWRVVEKDTNEELQLQELEHEILNRMNGKTDQ